MAHWSETYIGRPHIEGAHDCVDLVSDVLGTCFAKAWTPPPRACGIRARDAQIACLKEAYARPLAAGEAVCEGDIVLMRGLGRTRIAGHHIGVLVLIEGERHVLHCAATIGTVLQPLCGLAARGLETTGIYRPL